MTLRKAPTPPPAPARPHACSVCGHVGVWGDGWQWYGSYAMADWEPAAVVVTCSDKCRNSPDAIPLMKAADKANAEALRAARRFEKEASDPPGVFRYP